VNFNNKEIRFFIKLTAVYLFIFIGGIISAKISIDHVFNNSDTVKVVSPQEIGNPILKQTKKI